MEVRTEKIVLESSGYVDLSDVTTFLLPMIATTSLPTYSDVEGMIVYDTTDNKLKVCNGSGWETVTSS